MNLNYQQRFIVYGIGLVSIIFLWFFGFYNLQNKKIAEMKIEITKISNDLNRAKSSSEEIKKLQDEITTIKKDTEKMKENIPSKDKLLYISSVIQRRGELYGLEIQRIIPQKDILFAEQSGSSPIIRIPIELWITGKYFELGRFIESFDDFPFLLKAGSVTLSADNDRYPEIDIYLEVYAYLYR